MRINAMTSARLLLSMSVVLSTAAFVQVSYAEDSRLSMYLLYEAWDDETTPAHAAVMARWDKRFGNGQTRLALEFNTETLNLELDQIYLAPKTSLGGQLRAEAFGTNVLFDYFQNGQNDKSRTIAASNGLANVWLNWNPLSRVYIRYENGLRKWLINRISEQTSPDLILPENSFVYESRINVTWWKLNNDAAWSQRQRLYHRILGLALGATIGMNWQFDTKPWGARDASVFNPVDSRNEPEHLQWSITQWLLGGWNLLDGIRLQIREEASWAEGIDDLSRRTVGGLTPFTVNMPGMPWAYVHAGKFASSTASLHIRLPIDDFEIGAIASGLTVQDFERVGDSEFTQLWGVGGFMDYRAGDWQFDVRGGYSPALRSLHSEQGAWSVLGVVGWGGSL